LKENVKFGLKKKHLREIVKILASFPEVERAVLFGSRAKGNYRRSSDIDIAVYGKEISFHTILLLKGAFEESYLPFFVDVVNGENLKDEEFKKEIEKYGKVIYRKGQKAPYE